jgi:predicted glycogen debranching enzyme
MRKKLPPDQTHEWLEADGLGGFASGTTSGIPTRRYHTLLSVSKNPPTERVTLLNNVEVTCIVTSKANDTAPQRYSLSTFRYAPDTLHPEGVSYLQEFSDAPFPTWRYLLPTGQTITLELFVPRERPAIFMRWSATGDALDTVTLHIRPLCSGRDLHAVHKVNTTCSRHAIQRESRWYLRAYESLPEIFFAASGSFIPDQQWFYNFSYATDTARGYSDTEDLFSPGYFAIDALTKPAYLICGTAHRGEAALAPKERAEAAYERVRAFELEQRTHTPSRFHRAAQSYLVRRGTGLSIIAGYPWFTDWGRDTCISVRGLCIAQKKFKEAYEVLSTWMHATNQGMLPNRFIDQSGEAEFNSVDASLWFVVAVYELITAHQASTTQVLSGEALRELTVAVEVILSAYNQGTRYGIRSDHDGLLTAGAAGVQLTWMDAKYGDYVVTPRSGKPVELQALWINALTIGAQLLPQSSARWNELLTRAQKSFTDKFWNSARNALYDVIDIDNVLGSTDARIRPNQLFAIGGLPFACVDAQRGKAILSVVERELLTPAGLRTLSPHEKGYAGYYEGDEGRRCFAYHQGTVWPWLLGAFIEGWVRVRGSDALAKQEAYERFIVPLVHTLTCDGHIPEIADGDAPHHYKGSPFQAWSLAEFLRIVDSVLGISHRLGGLKNL